MHATDDLTSDEEIYLCEQVTFASFCVPNFSLVFALIIY